MTEFDKILIQKAQGISRWYYHHIDTLIAIADTEEARSILSDLRFELREAAHESL